MAILGMFSLLTSWFVFKFGSRVQGSALVVRDSNRERERRTEPEHEPGTENPEL